MSEESNIVAELKILDVNSIIIGNSLFSFIPNDLIKATPKTRMFVIITDSNVKEFYLEHLLMAFKESEVKELNPSIKNSKIKLDELNTKSLRMITNYVIPPGELSKTREMKNEIEDFLLEVGCNRDTCLIALGGGVIGDIVGFVASTFLRGIPYVQIPTTLLGMVDSSIGGKTGIDTPMGKNLIGSIYQPIKIYVDYYLLKTLPKREFSNGLAEIIKTCAISSMDNFEYLELNGDKISKFIQNMDKDEEKREDMKNINELISNIIVMCIKFKAEVVSEDVKDDGRRQLLNFGHTIGHAIELYYAPYLLHGECISIGMILEFEIGIGLNYTITNGSPSPLKRLRDLLHKFNLPISLQDQIIQNQILEKQPITIEYLLRAMRLDKKNSGGSICLIILKNLGSPLQNKGISINESDIINNIKPYISNIKSKKYIPNSAQIKNNSVVLIGNHKNLNQSLGILLAKLLDWNYVSNVKLLKIFSGLKDECIFTTELSTEIQEILKFGMSEGIIVINILTEIENNEDEYEKYEKSSNHTYFFDGNLNSTSDIEAGVQNLSHLIKVANGSIYNQVIPSFDLIRSFFVCLLIPEVNEILDKLPTVIAGTNALELRIDQLEPLKSNPETILGKLERIIAKQITQIRKKVKNHPIIYTLRTDDEGGSFNVKNVPRTVLIDLLSFGIRIGCEFIDIQINMEPEIIDSIRILSKSKTRIIGSFHSILKPLDWTGTETQIIFEKGIEFGDIVKLVSIPNSEEDNQKVKKFIERHYTQNPPIPPLIAFNIGKLGMKTRISNPFFTPVTHSALNKFASPTLSQLSCVEILDKLTKDGFINKRNFYLFGYPIAHSLSPLLHNTNFGYFKLPFVYELLESNEVNENIKNMIHRSNFGGASVTMPLKIEIQSILNNISPIARKIGAVNTIIKEKDGNLLGENTDWIGIQRSLAKTLNNCIENRPNDMSVLLIGGGGTARAALYGLGEFKFRRIFLCNRTYTKLADLMKCYPDYKNEKTEFICLKNRSEATVERLCGDIDCPLVVIVDTTPWNCGYCENSFVNQIFKNSIYPKVLVKLAYGGGMLKSGEESLNSDISVVTGIDVMIGQGIAQAEFWTGLKPDGPFLRKCILDNIKSKSEKEIMESVLGLTG